MGSCIFYVSLVCSPFQFILMTSCICRSTQTDLSIFFRLFEAPYTSIRSPLSLFFPTIGSFSLEILSLYGKSLRLGPIFVAALCILSIFFISLFLCGDQITATYSNFGHSLSLSPLSVHSKYLYFSGENCIFFVIQANSYL